MTALLEHNQKIPLDHLIPYSIEEGKQDLKEIKVNPVQSRMTFSMFNVDPSLSADKVNEMT